MSKKTPMNIIFIPEGCEEKTVSENDIETMSVFTLEERIKGDQISVADVEQWINIQRERLSLKPRCQGCRRLLEAIIKDAALLELMIDFIGQESGEGMEV